MKNLITYLKVLGIIVALIIFIYICFNIAIVISTILVYNNTNY